jgi:hypothetical protein
MNLRNRVAKLERFVRLPLTDRPVKDLTDAELNALIDAHSPPGNKPAAEWTAQELRAEIERVRADLKAGG